MLAEVAEGDPVARVTRQRARGARHQHLAAVGRRRDAGRPVDLVAAVVASTSSTSPECTPIRTTIGASSGHGWVISARWAATAPRIAARRRRERDEVRVALRPERDAALGRRRLEHDPALLVEQLAERRVAKRATSFVEPSMSVNRNVTVPVGSSGLTARRSVDVRR